MVAVGMANKALVLMAKSPFRSSLPKEFDSDYKCFDREKAVVHATHAKDLSDVGKYLKNKDRILETYYEKLAARLQQEHVHLSGSLQSEINQDPSGSHLSIKLLADFALSQTNDTDRLMTLEELRFLQDKLVALKNTRADMKDQLESNSKLIDNILSKGIASEDASVLKTLIESNKSINERLVETSIQLEENLEVLRNQHLLALSLCYFEDLQVKDPTPETNDKEFEEVMSYIAAASVQRNITLPTPAEGSDKSKWAKDCLDTLLSQASTGASSKEIKNDEDVGNTEDVGKIKTALKDLQFAHSYLTRQFEDERNLNLTVLETHEKKKEAVERQLSENIILLEKSNQRSILIEHEKNVLESKLDEKIKEVHELRRQVAILKIENLGYVSSDPDSSFSSPRGKENRFIPTSPLTGFQVSVDTDDQKSKYNSGLANMTNPKTPLLQQDLNSYRSSGQYSPKFNSSISVLRKEFKKLVSDLQSNFESELYKEKSETKRLQNLVKLLEEREDEFDQ